MTHFDNTQQANKAMELAIGRIFRLGSRPAQVGDIKLYEDAKYVIVCAAEYLGIMVESTEHCYIKDVKY